MKRLQHILMSAGIISLAVSGGFAQQADQADLSEKKVIVIREVVDADGAKTLEKVIAEGSKADDLLREIEMEDQKPDHLWISTSEQSDSEKEVEIENISVELESEDGENFVIIRKIQDGEEEIIKLGGLKGELTELEGELAKFRIRHTYDDFKGFSFEYSHSESLTNCAALGVYVGTRSDKVRISSIIGESGAETAGLQSGDVITAINSQEVNNYVELRQALSNYIPGDIVAVDFTRGDQIQSIEAELKAWKELPSMRDSYLAKVTCDQEQVETIAEDIQPAVTEKSDPTTPKDPEFTGSNVSPLNTLQLNEFSLFPNPSEGKVKVSFGAEAVPTLVKVVDLSGKEVYQQNLKDFDGSFEEEIDLTGKAKGAFILMVEQNGKVFSEQIAVQ